MRSEVVSADRQPNGQVEAWSRWVLTDAEIAQFQRTGLAGIGPDRHELTQVHHILSTSRASTRGQRVPRRDGTDLHVDGFAVEDARTDRRVWRWRSRPQDGSPWIREDGQAFAPFRFAATKDPSRIQSLDPQWLREEFVNDVDAEVLRVLAWKGRHLDAQLTRGEPIRRRQSTTYNDRVGAAADDAHETQFGTSFDASANSIIVAAHASNVTFRWDGGFLFDNAGIGQGASINSAALTLTSNHSGFADDMNGKVTAHDVDATTDFSADPNVFDRAMTAANTTWIVSDVVLDAEIESPDLTDEIQEVVDRASFTSSSEMTLIVSGRLVTAPQFNSYSFEGNSAKCAELDIDYGVHADPDTGALTLTGYAPTVPSPQSASPGVGALSLTGKTPTAVAPQSASPGVGALSLTGNAPSIDINLILAPGVGALALTGFAVTPDINLIVFPGTGSIVLTGKTPTAVNPQSASPGVGALALSAFAPSFELDIVAAPGVGALLLSAFAPTVLTPVVVAPGVGALVLTGFAPFLIPVVGVGSLLLTSFAPTVDINRITEPGAGALSLTGFAPTVDINLILAPGAGSLVLTGIAPITSIFLTGLWSDPSGDVAPARVYLHDAALRRIGELQASSVNRSFSAAVPRRPDPAIFRVPENDPLLSDLLALEEGRTVVIESSRYGDPWVGICTGVRADPAGRDLQVTAVEYAAVLQGRILGPDSAYGGVCSAVFSGILDDADAAFPTGLARGTIAQDITPASLRFQSESAWDGLNALTRACGDEWWTTATMDGPLPTVAIHFGPAQGIVHPHFALHDQATMRVDEWSKDAAGVLYALTVIGGARSAGEAFSARLGATAVDHQSTVHATSLSGYRTATLDLAQLDEPRGTVHGFRVGPSLPPPSAVTARHAVQIQQQLQAAGSLDRAARVGLLRRPQPDRLLRCTALSTADWTRCHPGDVITISAPTAFDVGYHGPVRILGAQPMEETGEMPLVVQTLERID